MQAVQLYTHSIDKLEFALAFHRDKVLKQVNGLQIHDFEIRSHFQGTKNHKLDILSV